jgi:hypothetical protein
VLLLLNIFLLILATMTAFTAIGGETWRKDQSNIFKSPTTRGWIAIVCLILTLGIGIIKEVITQRESENQKADNEQLKGQAKTQLDQIGELRSDLQIANKIITETREGLIKSETDSRKTAEAVQAHVYERLTQKTHHFLGLISNMIEDATDGWLPANESEFFSQRSGQLICRELNVDGPARVSPPQPWSHWFPQNIRDYKAMLAELIKAHSPQLDTALIAAMSKVEGSLALSFITQWQPIRKTDDFARRYPPLLCYGEGFLDLFMQDFGSLRMLFSEARKGARKFGVGTTGFPLPTQTPILGRNRFTPEQLTKWQRENKIPPQ